MAKKINEAGIKYRFKNQDEQPHGGSTWSTAKKPLKTYYVAVGLNIYEDEDSDPISDFVKGYERFNSYTQSFVKLLSIFPKDGGNRYNYIVKAMIGVYDEKSENDLKFAAENSVIKGLEDCGINCVYSEYPSPCKIISGGEDNGITKEVRPRGKEFNKSNIFHRFNESYLNRVISESINSVLMNR
jgi:hypothetical protein